MKPHSFRVVGRGVFALAEASRLTRIPSRRIRRWLAGYDFPSSSGLRHSPPAIVADFPYAARHLSLSFADLIEVRFVDHFLRAGVSWLTLRITAKKASELIKQSHPFSSWRFKTDGKTILTEIASEETSPELLDLLSDQVGFKRLLDPYLYRSLEFGPDRAVARWWHEAGKRVVVIDPERSLGRPILAKWGVPTRALADAFKVAESVERVAADFELPRSSVAAAIEFERNLAA